MIFGGKPHTVRGLDAGNNNLKLLKMAYNLIKGMSHIYIYVYDLNNQNKNITKINTFNFRKLH